MDAKVEFLLRLGDNALVLGHRVSEWCGVAPVLEEDIALANVSLDLIGQTQLWLGLAAEIEDQGRSADDLAFLRDAWEFRNLLLVEQPNRDFAVTMMRQFLFDVWHKLYLQALTQADDDQISAIADKSLKEVTYHLERSQDVVIALGDGTEVSQTRMQSALDRLWPYVGEMFLTDTVDAALPGIAPDNASLRDAFDKVLAQVMTEATLTIPDSSFTHKGGRTGAQHSEHLGHMLATMQTLQRCYPGASW
ncbi:MAG: 1,2-phenylacetyl-CoA epoxidase subunit PaaC [Aliishimia sp.]